MYLFTGKNIQYRSAVDFIRDPVLLDQDIKDEYAEALFKRTFNFKLDQEKQRLFQSVIGEMSGLIYEFANNHLRTIEDFYVLENYFLDLIGNRSSKIDSNKIELVNFKQQANMELLRNDYGHEPPKAAGSCGSTSNSNNSNNSFTSSNIFNSLSSLNSLFSEKEWFECPNPKCKYKANGPVGNECPGCGLTKEQYARESGAEVCE